MNRTTEKTATRKRIFLGFVPLLALWLLPFLLPWTSSTALADETDSIPVESGVPNEEPPSTQPVKKQRKKIREQKETDGTRATKNFETEAIIKSEYHLNGQPLEVDTD